jgi:hypothetical protein
VKKLFTWPIVLVFFLNLAIAIVGVVEAARMGSAHAVQRTGSIIAAITGLFVIWQVFDELLMERALRYQQTSEDSEQPSAVDRLAQRIQKQRQRRTKGSLYEARLLLVISIALWLSVGEAMHGFGDLAFEIVAGYFRPLTASITPPVAAARATKPNSKPAASSRPYSPAARLGCGAPLSTSFTLAASCFRPNGLGRKCRSSAFSSLRRKASSA